MPLTIAMRQLPIVRKSAVICCLLAFTLLLPGKARRGLGTYTGYDGTHFECVWLFVWGCLFCGNVVRLKMCWS
jgi:hypothetical protein